MTVSIDDTWTYERYLELPDDGKRYEVLGGRLFLTPSPSSYHQILSKRLQFLFYQRELEGQGTVFSAPIDLLLPEASPAQPDLLFLLKGQDHLITRRGIEGVPELVVEILSPSTATRDRTIKRRIYESSGVRRYLIFDPPARTLEVFLLEGGGYRLEAALGPDDSHLLDDYQVVISMPELLKGLPEEL